MGCKINENVARYMYTSGPAKGPVSTETNDSNSRKCPRKYPLGLTLGYEFFFFENRFRHSLVFRRL